MSIEKSIGHIAGRPAPNRWNEWVMDQDSIWVNTNNEVFLISDMSERYAYNVLRFLWRTNRLPSDPTSSPLVMALVRKLRKEWTYGEIRRGSLGEYLELGDGS